MRDKEIVKIHLCMMKISILIKNINGDSLMKRRMLLDQGVV